MKQITKLGVPKIKGLGLNNTTTSNPILTLQILHYPKNFNDYIQVEISTNYNPKLHESVRVVIFEKEENKGTKAIIDKYYEIKASNFVVNIPFNLLAQNKILNEDTNSIQCYLCIFQ